MEAGVESRDEDEAPHEQPGADEQHHGQRQLAGHEGLAREASRRPRGDARARLAEGAVDARAGAREGGGETEEHSNTERYRGHEEEDLKVDRRLFETRDARGPEPHEQ